MTLNFTGNIQWWQGLALALVLTWAVWRFYRREVGGRHQGRLMSWLPFLRCMAFFMVIMCLTGPVLTHRRQEGRIGRIMAFVDESESMAMTDAHMDSGRKLLLAVARKALPPAVVQTGLNDIRAKLNQARTLSETMRADAAGPVLRNAAAQCAALVQSACQSFKALGRMPLPAAGVQMGTASVEYFDGASAVTIDALLESTRFRQGPTQQGALKILESARNRGENYGTRIRGFLHPPASGEYTFWVSSDDASAFLLSTSDAEGEARTLARVQQYTSYRKWDGEAGQKSRPVTLEKDRAYYFEVRHVEGSGEDHVSVGWQRPDGTLERPIPGAFLSPYRPAPVVRTERLAQVAADLEGRLNKPAARLARAAETGASDAALRIQFSRLAGACSTWERFFDEAFGLYADGLIASGNAQVRRAMDRLNSLSRWERVQSLLLSGADGLLPKLQKTHHLQLLGLCEDRAEMRWQTFATAELPGQLAKSPGGKLTDLCTGIKGHLADAADDLPGRAVVLFTDGQHNRGPSPLEMAQLFGRTDWPLFVVGMGAHKRPRDLSVQAVEAPASVDRDDRLAGAITLSDDMPVGQPFTVRILDGREVVWEETFKTKGSGKRRLPFDFSVSDVVARKQKAMQRQVDALSLPVTLTVAIDPVSGETRRDNNTRDLTFRAVVHGRKILLLDGRPRWEWRYIHNLFARDQQWRIDALVASGDGQWRSGEGDGAFPADARSLFLYAWIIVGDIPPDSFAPEQLTWLRDFVEKRSGAILFIDGQRQHLKKYEDTPLGPLLPVSWDAGVTGFVPEHLALTATGRSLAALRIEQDARRNQAIWPMLPAPHWIAPVSALPGTEVMAEAVKAGQTAPLLVFRRFGGGRILYAGFDATWRWRYNVADRYHERYWHNLAGWLMERAFAVQDRHVSLDAGGPVYQQGDRVMIRARLRDRQGMPLGQAGAEAVFYRQKEKILFVPLSEAEGRGGLYLGDVAGLAPGDYQVGIRVEGLSELALKAVTPISIKPLQSPEWSDLTCNESLLRAMAEASGGRYLREEEAGELAGLLAPLSQGKIVEDETHLDRSFWLFIPLILLFTLEWLIRKRTGML